MDARVDMNSTRIKDGVGKDQLQVFYPEMSSSSVVVTKAFNISLQQMIGNSLLAEFHGGYGERIPTLSEIYGFYLFNRSDGFDYVGNTNLTSEKSISSDATLMFFNDDIQISATGFFRYLPDYIFANVDGAIRPMTAGANGVKIYHNINSATYYGADVSLLTKLNNYFRIVNVMKYTRAEDRTGTPLPMIPPLTNIAALQFTYKQWSIQSEFEGALRQTRINTSFGEDPTPAYMVFNLRAQCTVIKQRLIITGGIENLSDLTYHAHLDWGNVYRPGRNFYSTVTFTF
jgi:iron complex outermembrane receptor protein